MGYTRDYPNVPEWVDRPESSAEGRQKILQKL